MSKLKRRLERVNKGKRGSPDITSFCEDGCLVTAVVYKGDVCYTWVEGITTDYAGLRVLDEYIRYQIKKVPWKGRQDLFILVDTAVDEFIKRVKKRVKGG